MGIADLNELEIISGSFSLTFVIISLIIGVTLILKYRSLKNRTLLTVGLTWIFICSSWWSRSISFLTIIFFDFALDAVLYLFLLNAFIPIAVICWIYSFFSLFEYESKKRILIAYLVICIVYEVFLITFLFINTAVIGSVQFYTASGGPLSMTFQIFAIFSFLITGILFARKSLESNDPKIQLKGKLLLVAFISFTISALYESIMPLTPLTLALIRILLISSAIEYYFGFFMPNLLVHILTKQKESKEIE